jgi:uncharacterized membrane protein
MNPREFSHDVDDLRSVSRGGAWPYVKSGFSIGLVFGIVVLWQGFLAALLVVLTSMMGAGIGLVAHRIGSGMYDPKGAWDAFRTRRD